MHIIENNLKTSTEVLLYLPAKFFLFLLFSPPFPASNLPSLSPPPNDVCCLITFLRSFSLRFSFPFSLAPSIFFAFSYSLFCSYLVLPLLLASPKISLERPAIKWQPLRLSTISSGTRHCYVYRTSVLFFLVSLFLSFLSSVAASLNPIQSFDSRLRTGSILCCIASETVVPTTTRQFIDPCTIPRSDIQTTLQIVQFLSPCSRFFPDQHWFPITLFSACLISLPCKC